MSFLLTTAEEIPALASEVSSLASSVENSLDLTGSVETTVSGGFGQKVIGAAGAVAGGLDAYEHYKSQQDEDAANEAIATKFGNTAPSMPVAEPPKNPLNYNVNPIYNVTPSSTPIVHNSVIQGSYSGAGIA